MAEASQRPADVRVTAQPPAGLDAGSALPPLATETYRPVAILAIIGFILALLYCVCVLVGGLIPFARSYPRGFLLLLVGVPVIAALASVMSRERRPGRIALITAGSLAGLLTLLGLGGLLAFSGSDPWLLPGLTWLLAGAAVLISWLAWARIRESEGALSGLTLARWGVGLSLAFAVYYGVYRMGNQFAVDRQAQDCIEEYLSLIRDDRMPEAFLRTLKPGTRPPVDANLDEAIQVEFNLPRNPREPGQYDGFRMSDYVQFIRMSGKQASWKRTSASSTHSPAGYEITMTYDVDTVVGEFEVNLVAQSVESAGSGSRQWHVVLRPSSVVYPMKSQTPMAKEMEYALAAAFPMAREWINRVQVGKTDWAYLDTLPPAEREKQRAAWVLSNPAVGALAGFGPEAGVRDGSAVSAFRKGLQAFAASQFVKNMKDFRVPKDEREKNPRHVMVSTIERLFAAKDLTSMQLELSSARVPYYSSEGGWVKIRFPVRMTVRDPRLPPMSAYQIEAELGAEGPARMTPVLPGEFRVTELRLVRGLIHRRQMPPPRQ
jgi:hypothetical protein